MLVLAQGFAVLDWVVVGAYFALLGVTGFWFSRREQRDTEDYFLGGRSMPAWAVGVSVLATSLSAATFIGGPQQAYEGDLTYLATNIGMIIAAVVIAIWFIPALYRARVQTVYELLGTRFGPGSTRAASAAFMLGRVFASGARLYIVSIAAAVVLFGDQGAEAPIWQSLGAIGLVAAVGIVYTLVGGISSVIWSDVIQTGVFLVAVGAAIVVLLTRIPLDPSEIARVLSEAPGSSAAGKQAGKLTLISFSTDPGAAYSLWAILVGFTLLGIASYGTDQDLVQRMLTCKTARAGSWSVISAQLMGIPVVLLFMSAGLLLYIFYQRQDLLGDAAPGYAPDDSRKIFLSFILREMPAGMTGLMMAGLFAAGLSSLNSAINAMGSTFVSDFYRRWVPGRDAKHYVRVGRAAVVGWGIVLAGFAGASIFLQRGQTLIDFALSVMVFAYSGLLGVYFSALFTRRGSTRSVIAALVTGFVAVLLMQPILWESLMPGAIAAAPLLPDGVQRALAPIEWLVALAFPWKLALAAALSFGVCQLGSRTERTGAP